MMLFVQRSAAATATPPVIALGRRALAVAKGTSRVALADPDEHDRRGPGGGGAGDREREGREAEGEEAGGGQGRRGPRRQPLRRPHADQVTGPEGRRPEPCSISLASNTVSSGFALRCSLFGQICSDNRHREQ